MGECIIVRANGCWEDEVGVEGWCGMSGGGLFSAGDEDGRVRRHWRSER